MATNVRRNPPDLTALAHDTAREFERLRQEVTTAVNGVTLQDAYDNSAGADPSIQTSSANGPVRIEDATSSIGQLFAVVDDSGNDIVSVADDDITVSSGGTRHWKMGATNWELGPDGRRLFDATWNTTTGRMGVEVYPDDFSITTADDDNVVFRTDAARTITLNIPGGLPLGNDTAPGFISATHTARFEDGGFLFASQLLINAAVRLECAANIGPAYLFLDQYVTYADGGTRTSSQHNAMRAQPRWGPNINGGSLTQSSAELYFASCTVDATVGSCAITNCTHFTSKGLTLTSGGTVGTFKGLELLDIPSSGVTTSYGVFSDYSNATAFIRHEGTSRSQFGGPIDIGSGSTYDITIERPFADTMRMGGSETMDWDFGTTNNIAVTSASSAGLNFDTVEIAFGPSTVADGTNNWVFAFAPGLRGTSLGGGYSEVLWSSASAISIAHAIDNFTTFTINAPSISIGAGSIVNAANLLIQTNMAQGTNRYGLLITSNPTGGTLNYAMRVTAGDSRFDGRVDINNGVALGAGGVAVLGQVGGSGPTAVSQAQWLEVDIGGTAHWIPVWT